MILNGIYINTINTIINYRQERGKLERKGVPKHALNYGDFKKYVERPTKPYKL